MTTPTPEDNARSIALLQEAVDRAIAVIPQFEQRWERLNTYLAESQQREEQAFAIIQATYAAIAAMLADQADRAKQRNKVAVKSARISERAAKIVLGVFLLAAIAALFVIYGDPAYLQEELQRWYPMVVPAMLWATLELFGVDYQRPLNAIAMFLGFALPTNGAPTSNTSDEQRKD
jgi:hypothetical protein